MRIYNTLTRKIEEFIPNNKNEVKMYTCGPTVYHYAHIGNLRTYIFEDILEKSLNYIGYEVSRVMNITDVGHLTSDADTGEDKMAKGAKREGKTVYEIAKFYTDAFFEDCKKLNIKKPNIIESASNNIDTYIKMIEKMLNDGYAYIAGGNVYFDVSKTKNYYQLSGKNPEDLKVGVRDTVEEDISKRNQADFVLWFTDSKFKNQDMRWDSPWGVGYPGWHIECSGISGKYLGEHLDIHCGGVDNIFPHHTNEIAQSEAYFGHKWCNYWIHGEHLNDINGKMSKSTGEFLTVSLLEEKGYNPLSYRYFCLSSHYRKVLTFSYDILDGASNEYNKLKSRISNIKEEGDLQKEVFNNYVEKFKKSIEDDLNTSMCLTILYDLLKDNDTNGTTKIKIIEDFDKVLSLDLLKKEDSTIDKELESYIKDMIDKRNEYKKNKDYEKADVIREELKEKGILIKDTRDGTIYELEN